jgi:hypothetical protein
MPTDAQIVAAHLAFVRAADRWVISGVKDQHRWCIHENHRMMSPTMSGKISLDTIAEWRFDTREEAIFFKRDKCLRAALEAALATTD